MFSNRLEWDAPTNALGLLLAEKRSRAETLFDLTQSNPTQVGLDYPRRSDPRGPVATRRPWCMSPTPAD
jgi:hypothetical protein